MRAPLSDNPFAEPGDDDRTIVIPRSPRPAAAPAPPDPRQPEAAGSDAFTDLPAVSGSPVLSAAAPLLALLASLRNVATAPDPSGLRERAIIEVRRYEQALRDARLPLELIRASHYALCASLDDVVQNTPWGSRGSWASASLVSTFHQEVRSGDRFFDLLARLRQTPGTFLPVIELMYLCMSLGMQGRYRVSARGVAELDRVREDTYLVILRQRGAADPALSPHWRGVSAPYRPLRAEVPVWLAALAAAGLLGLAYALVLFGLNGASDRLFAAAGVVPPVAMPAIAREEPPKAEAPPAPAPQSPPPDNVGDRFARFLEPEVREGLVSIAGTPAAPIIRIQSAGMFASGSATIDPKFLPIFRRVGAALQGFGGPVRIVGHTDNVAIRTVAFPSNFELSQARAKAAGAAITTEIDPARITIEGRADAEPIASNATPAGRRANRRIELVAGREAPPR